MERIPPFPREQLDRLADHGWLDDPDHLELLRVVWTGPDPDGAIERLADYLDAAAGQVDLVGAPEPARRLAYLSGLSRELMRQLTRHPSWLLEVPEDDRAGTVRSTLARVAADEAAGVLDMRQAGRLLSDRADQVVGEILAEASDEGTPPLAIIAMGKWGGRELNYWSDIDLLFVFSGGAAEATAANRVAGRIMQRLGSATGNGVVLRADADLRPEGTRGPLARSLDAYRSYYTRWAEPWEFQALLKVRPAAGDAEAADSFLEIVREVLWPETINPDSIRALRSVKARVEEGASPQDLKRSPGGIRDIEFAVQMLQLVHGRFDEHLRRTGTLDLLDALSDGGYVKAEDADALAAAYRWLRNAEHRIQLWELRPTHELPTDRTERERLARAMGYRDSAQDTAIGLFEGDLVKNRTLVRRIHEDLYFRPLLEAFAATPATGLSREGAELRLTALGFRDVPGAVRTFEGLTAGLSRRSRLMQQMLPLILDWLADSPDPDLGLDQLRLLAASMSDHGELITTLHDRPVVGQRLAYLLGSSRLLGRYLDRIPEFVPRLDDDRTLTHLNPREVLEERLSKRLAARPDRDSLGTLRRFSRRHFLRVAARDLLGMADVSQTMADLSAGADAAVSSATDLAGPDRGFAVIAMGRWGGSELAYASDLDVLYVYDESAQGEEAQQAATELRSLLAKPAQDGIAWDLDARLRPEGKSGPLVRSLPSYRAYYERWAETWEFQSLVKARFVAGDVAVGTSFMDMIEPFVWRDPFPADAVVAIRQMKARLEKERVPLHEDPDFHLKTGPGGLMDVEFLVQMLQLQHGGNEKRLRVPSTLSALQALADLDILTREQASELAEAYRFCTHVRNRLYLQAGKGIDSLPRDPAEEWRLARSLGYSRRGDMREDYRRVTRRARRIFEDLFY